MPDRFKYSEVRQKIINALRTDLMGPQSENEILDENPKSSYIIGMLASQTEEKEASTAGDTVKNVCNHSSDFLSTCSAG